MTYIFNLPYVLHKAFSFGFKMELFYLLNELNNYRPVTLLPAFSTILEKFLNHRLLKYFKIKNIISKSQFGFKKCIY